MAEGDPQRQLLTLIRDFAAEKSKGERRVAALKQRFLELRPQLDAATVEFEDAKCRRESAEQELRGSEVELALNEASERAQQARISLLQGEIAKIRSEIEALRDKEGASRDDFINQMLEFNKNIRTFQESMVHPHKENYIELSSNEGDHGSLPKVDQNVNGKQAVANLHEIITGGEDNLSRVRDQIRMKVQEYEDVQNTYKEVLQETSNLERRVFLTEALVKETKELQSLARYPFCFFFFFSYFNQMKR